MTRNFSNISMQNIAMEENISNVNMNPIINTHLKRLKLNQIFKIGLLICCIMVLIGNLSGCAKKKGYGEGAADGINAADAMQFYGTNLTPEQEKALLSRNTYYFDLDSYEVAEPDIMSVYAHARKIICNNHCRVRVEGHTDERGSREYNVALGERRAKAVANMLILKGVRPEQISIVSYGKEKPAVLGHNDAVWSENRRAVIIYEGE